MKILWIVPITSPGDAQINKTASLLKRHAYPGTEIIIRKVSRGTESIESRVDEAYATIPIIEEVLKAEQEGFDACIIGCAGDAGLAAAKEAAHIPVVGPGEASLLIAQLIGRRVVLLTTLPERIPSIEEKVTRFIPRPQFFIYPVNIPVVELQMNVEKTIDTLVEIILKSKERDQADTAILACLGMKGMAEEVQRQVKIPVIDPALAALEMAQALVTMKLSQAKRIYPFPPLKRRFL
jgi:allantoin racemase